MTDSLVNRLRGLYEIGPNAEFGTRSFADFIPPISLEAANRIEELTLSLSKINADMDRAKRCKGWDSIPLSLHKSIEILFDSITKARGE